MNIKLMTAFCFLLSNIVLLGSTVDTPESNSREHRKITQAKFGDSSSRSQKIFTLERQLLKKYGCKKLSDIDPQFFLEIYEMKNQHHSNLEAWAHVYRSMPVSYCKFSLAKNRADIALLGKRKDAK